MGSSAGRMEMEVLVLVVAAVPPAPVAPRSLRDHIRNKAQLQSVAATPRRNISELHAEEPQPKAAARLRSCQQGVGFHACVQFMALMSAYLVSKLPLSIYIS